MDPRAHVQLRRVRRLLLVAVAGLLALGLAAPSVAAQETSEATRTDPLRILFMGDSLAYEARDYFNFVVGYSGRATVEDSLVFGGTAICDWFPTLGPKLKEFKPDIAVLEFAGNAISECMRDPATGKPYTGLALANKYWTDANKVMRTFRRNDVSVYWVNPPARCGQPDRPLTSVFIRLASRWNTADYIDTNTAVNRDGDCTFFLPCLDGEPCLSSDPRTGEPASQVRAPDGLHFCPNGGAAVLGVTSACSVWSSGAYRYATAVAVPIIQQYQLTPSTAPLLPPPGAVQRLASATR